MISHHPSQFLQCISRHFLSIPSNFSSSTTRLAKQECINYLQTCKSVQHLKQIQAQVFRIGLHQNRATLDKLMAFCTDPKKGNFLQYSERIFNYIEHPSLFVYNVMIKAFVKGGSFRKVMGFFHQLRVDGFWPDNFTYPFVFKAIGCLRDVYLGEKVHGFALKTGVEFECYVCNSIMDMYGELGYAENARKLFDEMPERDLVSWNIMISAYAKCARFEDAVHVFRRMQQEESVKPDEATVVSTLSACTAMKDLELGREIHHFVGNEIGFTPTISNALLDMYCKCEFLSIARQIFDAMPAKNVISWTSMVSGYVNCGQLDEARDLFERSPVRDVILWTALINGYVQFNRIDEAIVLFREMQLRRIKPDMYIAVALLTGCAQMGALEQGKWIHSYIDENRIPVDAVVGTALIDMYSKCGCIDKSIEIFRGLKEKDTAVWTSIICGLAMNGQSSKALTLFSEMKRAGFKPDDITFIGVLSACNHGGLLEEGRRYFDSMRKIHNIEPKLEHYGCLIDTLGRAGLLDEAEKIIETIPKESNRILGPVYGALLSACRIYGNVDIGERMTRRLAEMGYSGASVHTLMANIYASADRWEDVTKVRGKMKATGVKKAPGCSSIEVDGRVHEFIVGEASHGKTNEVHSMLDAITKPLSGIEDAEMEADNKLAVIS